MCSIVQWWHHWMLAAFYSLFIHKKLYVIRYTCLTIYNRQKFGHHSDYRWEKMKKNKLQFPSYGSQCALYLRIYQRLIWGSLFFMQFHLTCCEISDSCCFPNCNNLSVSHFHRIDVFFFFLDPMGVFMKIPNVYLSPKHFTLFVLVIIVIMFQTDWTAM